MKRPAQVQHPGAERGVDAVFLVVPALPVEGDLQRVLHRQCPTFDEEQMRQHRVAQDAGEGIDEPGHRHRVHVGIAGLVQGRVQQFGAECFIVGQCRMVHAQGRGRDEGEHVQIAPPVPGVDQIGTGRPLQIEHHIEAVDEDASCQDITDLVRFRRRLSELEGTRHAAHDSWIFTEF